MIVNNSHVKLQKIFFYNAMHVLMMHEAFFPTDWESKTRFVCISSWYEVIEFFQDHWSAIADGRIWTLGDRQKCRDIVKVVHWLFHQFRTTEDLQCFFMANTFSWALPFKSTFCKPDTANDPIHKTFDGTSCVSPRLAIWGREHCDLLILHQKVWNFYYRP